MSPTALDGYHADRRANVPALLALGLARTSDHLAATHARLVAERIAKEQAEATRRAEWAADCEERRLARMAEEQEAA